MSRAELEAGSPREPTSIRSKARPSEVPAAWNDARYSIALALLDFATVGGRGAIFVDRDREDTPFVAPYRVTVFWPVTVNNEERLYPFLRTRLGGGLQECDSPLFFLRDIAHQFAGTAWAQLGDAIGRVELPSLAECAGNLDLWRAAWRQEGVPKQIADAMGQHSHSYLRHVRSVFCIGTETSYGPLVLCFESTRKDGFSDASLTPTARSRYENFGGFLQTHIQERAGDHSDFWTWLLNTAWPWLTALTLAAPVLGWLIEQNWNLGALRWLSWLNPNKPYLSCAVLALLGFAVPSTHRLWQGSSNQSRIKIFQDHWRWVWGGLLSVQALFVVSALFSEPLVSRISGMATPALLALAAYHAFGCYAALTKFAPPGKPQEQQEAAAKVTTTVLLACLVIGFLGFVPESHLLLCPAGLLLAMSLCLLVGRLDSRLVGTPPYLVMALYLNALLHPLSAVLAIIDSSRPLSVAKAGSTAGALLNQHLVATTLTRLMSIPLTVMLFVVIFWTVQGRALERYLLNIERVARVVPRRSFSDALEDRWRRWPFGKGPKQD